jgi:hypothetical protein
MKNASISKSEAKGLGCEYYYRKYYVEKTPQHVVPWTRVGTQFHNFMDNYVSYLVEAGAQCDLECRVAVDDLENEAVEIINRFTETFMLDDPTAVPSSTV